MGCKAEHYAAFLKLVFKLSNIHGALVTMPHKVTTIALLDEVMTTAQVAGSCNAIRLGSGGKLIGDDGEGFMRGVLRKGRILMGARVLVVGSGGVGSAIVASLAKAGVAEIAIFDADAAAMNRLAERLRAHYPALKIEVGSRDPAGFDVVVMKREITPFLAAARARGCAIQVGTDMLFEQIPAYLEFFGLRTTTPDELRVVTQISY